MADGGGPHPPDRRHVATSALRLLARPPRRRLLLTVVTGTPVLAALFWYLGGDVLHSVAIGLCLAAVGLIWVAAPGDSDPAWPDDIRRDRPGRRDVVEMSWWLRARRGRVDDAALRRVRALARTRLAARQLDLDDPDHRVAIERLIGAGGYATLRADWRRPPLLRSVVRCVDALDNLDRRST